MSKKILVVGGFGYVGSFCLERLKILNIENDILDKNLYGTYSQRIPVGEDVRTDLQKIDLSQYSSIIFLAAIVGDPASKINTKISADTELIPLKYLRDNYKGRLVYASSASVYGASEVDELLTETSKTNPLSPYAVTKLLSEEILYGRPDTIIFRLSTLFGPSCASFRNRFDLIINKFVLNAMKTGEISIFNGNQYRPFLSVHDAAHNFVRAATEDVFEGKSEIYNIGELNLTINDVAKLLKNIYFPDLIINHKEENIIDARNYKVSFDKAIKDFNFKPTQNITYYINTMKEAYEPYSKYEILNPIHSNFNWLSYLNSIGEYK